MTYQAGTPSGINICGPSETLIWGLQRGILRPSCKRRGLPHNILFGRGFWVILWEPGKPVITDELEVCLWCWSSAPWYPCYDIRSMPLSSTRLWLITSTPNMSPSSWVGLPGYPKLFNTTLRYVARRTVQKILKSVGWDLGVPHVM